MYQTLREILIIILVNNAHTAWVYYIAGSGLTIHINLAHPSEARTKTKFSNVI